MSKRRSWTYEQFFSPSKDSVGIYDSNKIELIPLSKGYNRIEFLNDSVYCGFLVCFSNRSFKKILTIIDLYGQEIHKSIEVPDISSIFFKRTLDNKFYFELVYYEGEGMGDGPLGTQMTGIIDVNGELIVPFCAGDINYDNNRNEFYIQPSLSSKEFEDMTLAKLSGDKYNDVRPRKYLNIKLKDSYKYEYYRKIGDDIMSQIDTNLRSLPVFCTNYIESNGFAWTKLEKGYNDPGHNKHFGAINIQGDTIIPLEWNIDEIKYKGITQNMGYFEIRKGVNVGLTSLQGNIIIPIKYNIIRFNPIDKIGGLFIGISLSDKSSIHDLNGNEIVRDMDDVSYIEPSKGDIGYLLAKRDDCYGAYDIYGNCIVPLGTKGNKLHYGKKGFYFADDRKYLGIQIDEYGAADYSLRKEWDRQAREKEEERRRKKEQRRNFWTNFGNALVQSALGYLGMQSQHMMPMGAGYNMPSSIYNQTVGPLAQQMSQPGYFNNVYQELMFTSMAQVQQQEMWEYNQARQGALAMGKDLTLDEWRYQRGAAIQALKEQGVDIIAEQNERNRQNNREWRESLSQDSKDRLQKIKDYNQMKYVTSSGSSSSSSTNRKSGQLSHSTSQGNNASNYNTTSYPQTSTNRNNSVSNANTQTKPNDSHQQYKNGNKNVSSSDYTYIQRVTLYRQDGSSFRVAKQNAELYEKGATEYIKIGGTFFPAQNPGKVTEFRKRIVYGGVGLYYN